MRLPALLFLFLAGCSLTPIPDVTSEWSQPCEPVNRLCAIDFKLKEGSEQTVELRGTFRGDGWMKGEAMTRVDGSWTARVTVPWGAEIQYKFFVNGSTWVFDPANPETAITGGTTNSVVRNVSCAKWTCVAHSG